jgi:hypothetical protein
MAMEISWGISYTSENQEVHGLKKEELKERI